MRTRLGSLGRQWLAVAGAVVACIALALIARAPASRSTGGTLSVLGLDRPVVLERASTGSPHVVAHGADDAWFGLGFAMAEDRPFQIELLLRVATGALSEWVGSRRLAPALTTADLDALLASQELATSARASLARAPAPLQRRLQAFAAGGNAALRVRPRSAGHRLLAATPRPWQPEDPLILIELFGLVGQIPGLRLQLLEDALGHLPEPLVRALLAVPGSEVDLTAREPSPRPRPVPLARASIPPWTWCGGPLDGVGSNAWVVPPGRSASGAPLLAADPHVALDELPTFWYLAGVTDGTTSVQGLLFPGVPVVVMGHGRSLAWASTTAPVRSARLVELRPGAVARLAVTREHAVGVRFGRDRSVAIRHRAGDGWTRTLLPGPWPELITGDGTRGLALDRPDVDAARWLAAMDALGQAADVRGALADADGLAAAGFVWNHVVADDGGTTALTTIGRTLTSRGSSRGVASREGDETERVVLLDPRVVQGGGGRPAGAQRVLISANHDLRWPSAPGVAIDARYELPYRAERLSHLLARATSSPAEMRDVALDVRSGIAEHVLPVLLSDLRAGAAVADRGLVELLERWDLECDARSAGCLIFEQMLTHLPALTFSDELGEPLAERYLGTGDVALAALLALLDQGPEDASWWDDVRTPPHERRVDIVRAALAAARDDIEAWLGPEPGDWSWGRVHTLTLRHPLARLPLVGRAFRRGPYPVGGTRYTVAAAMDRVSRRGRAVVLGASTRLVVDLGAPEVAYLSATSSPAEAPRDPAGTRMTELWLAGRVVPFVLDPAPGAARTTLTLAPTPTSAHGSPSPTGGQRAQ